MRIAITLASVVWLAVTSASAAGADLELDFARRDIERFSKDKAAIEKELAVSTAELARVRAEMIAVREETDRLNALNKKTIEELLAVRQAMNEVLVKRAAKDPAPNIERQNTINTGWQAQRERSDSQEMEMSTRVKVAKSRADLVIAEEELRIYRRYAADYGAELEILKADLKKLQDDGK